MRSTIHRRRVIDQSSRKESSGQKRAPIRSIPAFVLDTCRSSLPRRERNSGWNVVTRVPVLPAETERERASSGWNVCLECTQLSPFRHLTPRRQ